MSSSVIDLLMEESLCTVPELIKSMSEDLEESDLEVEPSVDYKGDAIGQLLDQMVQILPPEERNIFGCSEDKNIEEIILEANELIRSSTPIFSSSDSTEKSKKWKLNLKSLTKSPINSKSSNLKHSSEHSEEHSGTNTINSSLESIIVKSSDDRNIQTEESGYLPTQNYKGVTEDVNSVPFIGDNIIKQPVTLQINRSVPADDSYHSTAILNENRLNNANLESTNKMETDADNILKSARSLQGIIQNSITETVSQAFSNDEGGNLTKLQKHTLYSQAELESKVKLVQQKYENELQDLKSLHIEEVQELTGHIHKLNDKIDKFKKQYKNEKSSDVKDQHLERLESEISSQEQLLIGYEKENKKLCKEISALKDVWNQRESKLLEEKRRLQNELLGMVSKNATENLEEQLKDAQETIVKLRLELTTSKSCNKELEANCERLRSESQRLQAELANCNCERSPGRRDRYSFLASSNVGHQIQQLKNVIARKDAEIAQMNSALEILRGEMGCSSGAGFKELSVGQQLETHSLTISQLQTALAVERQHVRDLSKEKELLLKENFDLKRQVRELESIVKRRQKSDSCFPVTGVSETQTNSRLLELEKELSTRQESLNALHSQFLNMQKKYEDHIEELEARLKECREEIQNLKTIQKKEEASSRLNTRKIKQTNVVVKEETHLLATIRGLRQETASREKEINKLNKEIEEVRLTNKRLQKEREKQLNSMSATKMAAIREKANLRKVDKGSIAVESRTNLSRPNNNKSPVMFAELQEANLILRSKTNSLQEEVKKLEQDLITMHNKRVHDLNALQSEHELEVSRLMDERAAFLSHTSTTELQGQLYTQQMVINHLKNRLKQMEELKNEVTLLRAERDHLEESLAAVNKKMSYLQNAQSPEGSQYKTLLAKLETLEKNQEIREQKLNSVRELLSRSTQAGPGAGPCGGSCRDKLLDKNRQICYYRAQMDRILEALLDIRRTK